MLDETVVVVDARSSDNASGADNQQERFSIDAVEKILRDYTPNFEPSRAQG